MLSFSYYILQIQWHGLKQLNPKTLIINDVNEAGEFGNYQPDLYVIGDSGEYIKLLLEADDRLSVTLAASTEKRSYWLDQIQRSFSKYYDFENCSSEVIPLYPAHVATQLRKIMPKELFI